MKQVARIIQGHIRQSDLMARRDHHHFWLLLSNTDEEHAVNLAERLATSFRQLACVADQRIAISVKIVCCLPGEPLDTLMERAEAA